MISAKVLADSINNQGNRLTTFVVETPRIVWSEFMTHRMFSRNAASSRAIPFAKMVEQLNGRPVRFGANQSGMQDKGEDHNKLVDIPMEDEHGAYYQSCSAEGAWLEARARAIEVAEGFHEAGYHKQVVNRLTEPFQMMKAIVTATEFENYFWLRDDDAADPTIRELAVAMKAAYDSSTPEPLLPGQWHLPFVGGRVTPENGPEMYADLDDEGNVVALLTLDEAIKVSCARCAAISYRNSDYDLAKSLEVYERLVGSDKKHSSAFEHCATPVREWGYYESEYTGTKVQYNRPWIPYTWEEGITHVDRKGKLWSGNLKGWIQYRKLIKGENYEGEEVA